MANVMIIGTASNVGKSIVCAGIIRCLKLDGYSVAPFKSQNMSLNSFIDKEGGEMGRAQVFQAEAAEIEPMSYMNPILLKPCGRGISQVIVDGKFVDNMSSDRYREYKKELVPVLSDIYSRISSEYDVVVIEGAGSPVELNINHLDISNMEMARIANASVILVADIDRGGVFASVVGTLSLLKEDERKRVKGIIINKFRGIKGSFSDGARIIEDITGVKVLGVLPYMDIKIEEEDGVSDRLFSRRFEPDDVNIAVIKTPHMSNATDFEVFEHIDGVSVKYISLGERLDYYDEKAECYKSFDAVILPGSKNTIDDMISMRCSGMDERILDYYRDGGKIFGICGGYQILGRKIIDESGVDTSEKSEENGIGIFDMDTVFRSEKSTSQVSGSIVINGDKFEINGYELHFGRTENSRENTTNDGFEYTYREGVFGTYCHGIFDNLEFTYSFINEIRRNKKLSELCTEFSSFYEKKMIEYNKLASLIRDNLDMDELYSIIKKGNNDVEKGND